MLTGWKFETAVVVLDADASKCGSGMTSVEYQTLTKIKGRESYRRKLLAVVEHHCGSGLHTVNKVKIVLERGWVGTLVQ